MYNKQVYELSQTIATQVFCFLKKTVHLLHDFFFFFFFFCFVSMAASSASIF